MKVSLVVAEGPNRGRGIVIRDAVFLIGRDPGCQIRASSDSISRKHCEILVGEDDVVIRDLGSTNGTLLNGVLIRSDAEVVRNGDRLEVGPLAFVVRIVVPAAPATSAEQPTKMMNADGTFMEGKPEAPASESVRLNENGNDTSGEITAAPTRAEAPVPSAGPPTARSRAKQPPPAAEEGVSKAASDLIKKMLAKSPRRPPPGGTGTARPLR